MSILVTLTIQSSTGNTSFDSVDEARSTDPSILSHDKSLDYKTTGCGSSVMCSAGTMSCGAVFRDGRTLARRTWDDGIRNVGRLSLGRQRDSSGEMVAFCGGKAEGTCILLVGLRVRAYLSSQG